MSQTTARVALVAHRFSEEHPSGIGRSYREISLALARRRARSRQDGHDDGLRYELTSPPEPAPAWLPAGLTHRTIRGRRGPLAAAWTLAGRPLLDDRAGSPDLVHVLHPWVPTPTRAPLVVTLHDLMPLLHPEWYPPKARWMGRRGLRAMADQATAVAAVSSFVAEQAHEHLHIERERLTVVPEGVAPAFLTAPTADSPAVAAACAHHGVRPGRYVVAVGQLSVRKNLSPVLRALSRLDRIDPSGADLLLCGADATGAAAVHAEIDRLCLGDRVRATGFVGEGELPALVAGALALVHPSLDEGFGFPPLEAMAAGTPAIVSTAGALPEVVGDAGIPVDPHDADAWAAAIAALREDPQRRAELVDLGRRQAARFTWDTAAEHLSELHRSLLQGTVERTGAGA